MNGKITEIFESIQGEGLYAGERHIFVRFFGCNRECNFCDTKPDSFEEYESERLLIQLKRYQPKLKTVSFTGGEPLLQADFLEEILKLTRKEKFVNYLETNGTLPNELSRVIDYVDIIAMDFKLPSSTNLRPFWDEHRLFLTIASEKDIFIKAVVCHSTEESDLMEAIRLIRDVKKDAIMVLQPNSFQDDDKLREKLENFRETCIQNKVSTCIIPQMHRALGLR